MNALVPGLYRATVNGVADVTVMKGRDELAYLASTGHLATRRITWDNLTDARPLIVLDFDSDVFAEVIGDLRYAVGALAAHSVRRAFIAEIADQIEAQTKPARIPEPGVGGVVKASTPNDDFQCLWLHGFGEWRSVSGLEHSTWRNLIDPTLIRDGIES